MLYRSCSRWVFGASSVDRNFVCIFCHHPNQHGYRTSRLHVSTRRAAKAKPPRRFKTPQLSSQSGSILPPRPRAHDVVDYQLDAQEHRLRRVDDVEREEVASHTAASFDTAKGGNQLLELAYKNRLHKVEPRVASQLLDDFKKLGARFSATTLKDFCKKNLVAIDDVYVLARLLLRSRNPLDRHIGRKLLLLTSQLGSAKATIHVAKTALKQKELSAKEIEPSLRHLAELVKHEPPIIPALIVQADIYLENAKTLADQEQARNLYLEATKAETSSPMKASRFRLWLDKYLFFVIRKSSETLEDDWTAKNFTLEEDNELDAVAAHVKLGDLCYFVLNDIDQGLKHWRIAALDHDDPTAYFHLAEDLRTAAARTKLTSAGVEGQFFGESEFEFFDYQWLRHVSTEWYHYVLKAAASGHPEACHQIGLLYMMPDLYPNQRFGALADRRLERVLKSHPLFKQPHAYVLDLLGPNRKRQSLVYHWLSVAHWLESIPVERMSTPALRAKTLVRWMAHEDTNHTLDCLEKLTQNLLSPLPQSEEDRSKTTDLLQYFLREERAQKILRSKKQLEADDEYERKRQILQQLKDLNMY